MTASCARTGFCSEHWFVDQEALFKLVKSIVHCQVFPSPVPDPPNVCLAGTPRTGFIVEDVKNCCQHRPLTPFHLLPSPPFWKLRQRGLSYLLVLTHVLWALEWRFLGGKRFISS